MEERENWVIRPCANITQQNKTHLQKCNNMAKFNFRGTIYHFIDSVLKTQFYICCRSQPSKVGSEKSLNRVWIDNYISIIISNNDDDLAYNVITSPYIDSFYNYFPFIIIPPSGSMHFSRAYLILLWWLLSYFCCTNSFIYRWGEIKEEDFSYSC